MPKKKKGSERSFDSIPGESEGSIPGSLNSSPPPSKKGRSQAGSSKYSASGYSEAAYSESGYSEGTRKSGTTGYTGTSRTGTSRTGTSRTGASTAEYSEDEGADGYTDYEGYTETQGGTEYEEEEEEWTEEHLKILYLISKYAQAAQSKEDKEGWIRETQLLVLIYEGVVAGALDYDYAPAAVMIGKRNCWMNISQDGKDDLDDLREMKALNGLKLQSSAFQSITAYQVSLKGLEVMDALDYDARKDIDNFLYAPPPYQTELLHPEWRADEGEFVVWTGEGGFERPSTVTETEDVSYVSSPWLPQMLRKRGREHISNAHRAGESAEGGSTIADELNEVITLKHVNLLVGEWVPFGANQIVALNERLGAYDRCKGGMFSAQVDSDPTANTLATDVGLTEVEILDFEDTEYINFEAEINYPEDEGIVQVENFGIHLSKGGTTIYGMRIEAILDRGPDSISLDHLSRLLVDVHQDSSKILESLLSGYQTNLLDMVYMGFPLLRDKFNMIIAEDIEPRVTAAEYCDKEDKECELKQVIGPVLGSYDLGEEDFVIQGKVGVLVVGPNSKQFEAVLMCYLALLSNEMFVRAFFIRTFILSDELTQIRQLIMDASKDPMNIQRVRDRISLCSREIIMMQGLLGVLKESTERTELPQTSRGGAANAAVLQRLLDVFKLAEKRDDLKMRVIDLMKNVKGALQELMNLQSMTDVINKKQLEDVLKNIQGDTRVLVDAAAVAERGSKSLEVMQVVLAASMAFDLIDRFTAFNMGIDIYATGWQTWIAENLIYPPGAWFAFNMLCGVLPLCWSLLRLMAKLGEQSLGFVTIRLRINRKMNLKRWGRYLSEKDIESSDTSGAETNVVKKVMWTEDEDEEKWLGPAPAIEAMWDDSTGFLLQVAFSVDAKEKEWEDELQLRDIWQKDLDELGVFDLKGKK
eukprot:COSAG02_NODE_1582_length_11838_cov_3.471420_3_plen_926_part_00